jgi:hypothetical protein
MKASKNIKKETRREKFERLATQRTNEVLKKLRILGNCANKNFYEYSDTDVRKIFSAIEEELRLVKARFLNSKRREFKL